MAIPLTQARIGYAGYEQGWNRPGDRRRFVAYASQRGLAIEPARLDREYDVAFVTYNGNLPAWIQRKKKRPSLRLIFELLDSYLTQSSLTKSFAKGAARFATGMDGLSHFHFNKTLAAMCRAADAVICSTDEQSEAIRDFNPNVHTSFDFFDAEIGAPKVDYALRPPVKLVWEGQANSLSNLLFLTDTLNALGDRIELHVVTDAIRYRHFNRFRPVRSSLMLDQLTCPVTLHPWMQDSFGAQVVAADVAIIPIDLSDGFAAGKPENKLIMLWKLGMPVIASATPAYARAMAGAGLDLTARAPGEWRDQIETMANLSAGERGEIARRGSAFAARKYSQEAFAERFDAVFRSIGFAI